MMDQVNLTSSKMGWGSLTQYGPATSLLRLPSSFFFQSNQTNFYSILKCSKRPNHGNQVDSIRPVSFPAVVDPIDVRQAVDGEKQQHLQVLAPDASSPSPLFQKKKKGLVVTS